MEVGENAMSGGGGIKREGERRMFKSQRNEKAKFRVNQCEGCNLVCEQGT
jgi:hypothetical protein